MRNSNRLMPFQGSRLILFMTVMIATLVVMVIRLYDYQFVQRERFVIAANENAIQSVPLPAPRGVIYDRNGVGLALNSPAWLVTVTPASLPDDDQDILRVLNRLSALIGVPSTREAADAAGKRDVRSLDELVREGRGIAPYRAVVVQTDVAQEIAQQILEDLPNLPGVNVEWSAVRQYPTGESTAQLVGYLGPIGEREANELRAQGYNPSFERTGYSGIEASMNDQLGGLRGRRVQKVDVAGRIVEGGLISETPPRPGMNIRLSVDVELQRRAQSALQQEIDAINTEKNEEWTLSGVVVALNPQTGEILAMVSLPTYDNKEFERAINARYYFDLVRQQERELFPLINQAIGGVYPPGSTWKVLTSIAVMNERVIDPGTFLNDAGELRVRDVNAPPELARDQIFVCWTPVGHGQVNMVRAIAESCDVYYYQVGGGNPAVSPFSLRPGGLGINNLVRYGVAFGIGEPTMIELIGEQRGNMPDPDWKRRAYSESWTTGDTYNAAFGQGFVVVTPLQLANMTAAIANGGTLYHPTIISGFEDSEGNRVNPLTSETINPSGGKAQDYQGKPMRTLVFPANNSTINPAWLLLGEDMRVRGRESLACLCERRSPFNLNSASATTELRDRYGMQIRDTSQPDVTPEAKRWVCDPEKVLANYRPTIPVDFSTEPPKTIERSDGRRIQSKLVEFRPVTYGVFVPFDYTFSDGLCNENIFIRTTSKLLTRDKDRYTLEKLYAAKELFDLDVEDMGYQPPFTRPEVLAITQKGMAETTKARPNPDDPRLTGWTVRQGTYDGTAGPAAYSQDTQYIGYSLGIYDSGSVATAGKTGTAEYCDQIAKKKDLCKPGQWPAHAWFIGYAPETNPEIVVTAFVYHGNEGARHAVPIVRKVSDCYFRLKDARKKGLPTEGVCSIEQDVPATK
jgi:penicillin-binding protein 2